MMKDKEIFEKFNQSSLFPKTFVDDIPVAKALDWLHKNDVIFVLAPCSEICVNSHIASGGIAPYFVRFVAFGRRAKELLGKLTTINPLFRYQEHLSSESNISKSFCYTTLTSITYAQFIELTEYTCKYFKNNQIIIKRFETNFDDTGILRYYALPKDETFMSFLDGYEGEADIYDSSFLTYIGDIMSENFTLQETENAYTKPG